MNPDKLKAVKSLLSNTQASFDIDENGNITNWASDAAQPTDAEIQTKLDELQADYDAKQYQRDRQYPSIGDQLDMIFHAGEGGAEFQAAIQAVKDANPKPSE